MRLLVALAHFRYRRSPEIALQLWCSGDELLLKALASDLEKDLKSYDEKGRDIAPWRTKACSQLLFSSRWIHVRSP